MGQQPVVAGRSGRSALVEMMLARLEQLQSRWWRQTGLAYSDPNLLLRFGRFYPGRRLPVRYRREVGQPNRCFRNCAAAAAADRTLRYCEGLVEVGDEICSHAWCLDPDGKVVELTIDNRSEDPKMWSYWGVVFEAELALDYMATLNAVSAGLLGQLAIDLRLLG